MPRLDIAGSAERVAYIKRSISNTELLDNRRKYVGHTGNLLRPRTFVKGKITVASRKGDLAIEPVGREASAYETVGLIAIKIGVPEPYLSS